jgi:hypothetical protein
MWNRRRIERTADGDLRLRLSRSERGILRSLREELQLLLEDDPDDPDLRRLFPPAYGDAEEEAEYRRLVGDELLEGRRQALETLRATVDRDRLTPDEAQAWLTALNDVRLVLGTRLGVTEETFLAGVRLRDPRARELAVYAYLSWLQEQLVEELSAGLA